MGSNPNLPHLFSISIDLLVFQSKISIDPSFFDRARRSIVPAIGCGSQGLNTIFSTTNMSSFYLNKFAISAPRLNVLRSLSSFG